MYDIATIQQLYLNPNHSKHIPIAKAPWNSTSCFMSPARIQFSHTTSQHSSLSSVTCTQPLTGPCVLQPGGWYFIALKHSPPFRFTIWKRTVKCHFALKTSKKQEVYILASEKKSKPTNLNYTALILPSSAICQTKHKLHKNVTENYKEREKTEDSINQMVQSWK